LLPQSVAQPATQLERASPLLTGYGYGQFFLPDLDLFPGRRFGHVVLFFPPEW
jgi:hypothetical protein